VYVCINLLLCASGSSPGEGGDPAENPDTVDPDNPSGEFGLSTKDSLQIINTQVKALGRTVKSVAAKVEASSEAPSTDTICLPSVPGETTVGNALTVSPENLGSIHPDPAVAVGSGTVTVAVDLAGENPANPGGLPSSVPLSSPSWSYNVRDFPIVQITIGEMFVITLDFLVMVSPLSRTCRRKLAAALNRKILDLSGFHGTISKDSELPATGNTADQAVTLPVSENPDQPVQVSTSNDSKRLDMLCRALGLPSNISVSKIKFLTRGIDNDTKISIKNLLANYKNKTPTS
jgi:hypothetical protein